MDGINYFFIISRSRLAAVNNKKKFVQISFLFLSKTWKSFVGGPVNLKIKNSGLRMDYYLNTNRSISVSAFLNRQINEHSCLPFP